MYLAKAANSRIAFYDASHDGTQQEQLVALGELRRARRAGRGSASTSSRRSTFAPAEREGAEALVRWMHPLRGIVPPIEFMPFAERTGFVRTVTRWVLETTR